MFLWSYVVLLLLGTVSMYKQQWVWVTECECEWGKVSMSGKQDIWVWVCVVEYECEMWSKCDSVENGDSSIPASLWIQ